VRYCPRIRARHGVGHGADVELGRLDRRRACLPPTGSYRVFLCRVSTPCALSTPCAPRASVPLRVQNGACLVIGCARAIDRRLVAPITRGAASPRPPLLHARNARGYVDDRLAPTGSASPASRASSESGEVLAFAHIPTGTTTATRFADDHSKGSIDRSWSFPKRVAMFCMDSDNRPHLEPGRDLSSTSVTSSPGLEKCAPPSRDKPHRAHG
jgi:hypothetical protein